MTRSECEDLVLSLASTPAAVRRLANGLSFKETQWKPEGGEFSVVENICHLRDIEVEGYAVRIKRILLEDQPFLSDLDGARLAEERDYNSQDFGSAMEAFTEAREDNVRTIKGVSSEQLTRTGTLENSGIITLERLIEMMREHDQVHITELTALHDLLARST